MARLSSNIHPILTDDVISRLQSKKIYTTFDVMSEDSEKLMKITGLSYKDTLHFKQTISHLFGGKIKKASVLLSLEQTVMSTGIASLDGLLKGGLCPGNLYEICGLSSSGKTQLCHTIATNVALSSTALVHYIDTKKDFCATRIQMILEGKKCSDEEIAKVMDQIKVTRVKSIQELLSTLHYLKSSLRTLTIKLPTKLVIIDSLPAIFLLSSVTYDKVYALNHLSNVSRCFANELNVPFITVNLITQWRDVDGFTMTERENPKIMKPTLGKYWLHVPNTRLLVQKLEKEIRKVTVWKSFHLRTNSTCLINITDVGVI